MKAYWIAAPQIPEWWPKIAHLLHKAAETQTEWTLDGILARLKSEEWRLWIAWDDDAKEAKAAIGTLISETDSGEKRCSVSFGVGTHMADGWPELVSEIEEWARGNGCQRMVLQTRPGWARVLKGDGYAVSHVVIEKEL